MVKGVGWATVLINFMTAMFYNTIISWAVYYLVMSFNGIITELPWKSCHHQWNSNCCISADINNYLSKPVNITGQILNPDTGPVLPKGCNRSIYSTEEYF